MLEDRAAGSGDDEDVGTFGRRQRDGVGVVSFSGLLQGGHRRERNHDNRNYEDDWDERWAGLEKIGPDGKSNYDTQANQNYAKKLKGL